MTVFENDKENKANLNPLYFSLLNRNYKQQTIKY
jgi:hypothetical protein